MKQKYLKCHVMLFEEEVAWYYSELVNFLFIRKMQTHLKINLCQNRGLQANDRMLYCLSTDAAHVVHNYLSNFCTVLSIALFVIDAVSLCFPLNTLLRRVLISSSILQSC